tara:strand:- start:160 stop:381 length:222 start_codon:yes stop_codon:yes gene_type:complete
MQREKRTPKDDSSKGSRANFTRKTMEKVEAKKLKKLADKAAKKKKKQDKGKGKSRKPSQTLVAKLRAAKENNS